MNQLNLFTKQTGKPKNNLLKPVLSPSNIKPTASGLFYTSIDKTYSWANRIRTNYCFTIKDKISFGKVKIVELILNQDILSAEEYSKLSKWEKRNVDHWLNEDKTKAMIKTPMTVRVLTETEAWYYWVTKDF
jgi:hypothetical protein